MGELRCGGVAVWGSCGVGELRCGGVAVWSSGNVGSGNVGEWYCVGVMVVTKPELIVF